MNEERYEKLTALCDAFRPFGGVCVCYTLPERDNGGAVYVVVEASTRERLAAAAHDCDSLRDVLAGAGYDVRDGVDGANDSENGPWFFGLTVR